MTCDGYAAPSRQVQAAYVGTQDLLISLPRNPSRALFNSCVRTQADYQAVTAGLGVLANASLHDNGAADQILKVVLPYLCFSVSSVCAVVAALGSAWALEASCYSDAADGLANALKSYHFAVNRVRKDLATRSAGPVPLLLSASLLSLVELLLQKDEHALFHLSGAYRLLDSIQRPRDRSRYSPMSISESSTSDQ